MTAAQWRNANEGKACNMRDCATIEQLLVLANLENINALYINKGIPQSERISELNLIARSQISIMLNNSSVKWLKEPKKT
jgi:hypothetical protein